MKKLIYRVMKEYNRGTEEYPDIQQTFITVEQLATAENYERLYEAAIAEACGEVIVEDVPDVETEPTGDELMDILLGVGE